MIIECGVLKKLLKPEVTVSKKMNDSKFYLISRARNNITYYNFNIRHILLITILMFDNLLYLSRFKQSHTKKLFVTNSHQFTIKYLSIESNIHSTTAPTSPPLTAAPLQCIVLRLWISPYSAICTSHPASSHCLSSAITSYIPSGEQRDSLVTFLLYYDLSFRSPHVSLADGMDRLVWAGPSCVRADLHLTLPSYRLQTE